MAKFSNLYQAIVNINYYSPKKVQQDILYLRARNKKLAAN